MLFDSKYEEQQKSSEADQDTLVEWGLSFNIVF